MLFQVNLIVNEQVEKGGCKIKKSSMRNHKKYWKPDKITQNLTPPFNSSFSRNFISNIYSSDNFTQKESSFVKITFPSFVNNSLKACYLNTVKTKLFCQIWWEMGGKNSTFFHLTNIDSLQALTKCFETMKKCGSPLV